MASDIAAQDVRSNSAEAVLSACSSELVEEVDKRCFGQDNLLHSGVVALGNQ